MAESRQDLARLLKHRNRFVRVPCPACADESLIPAFRKLEINYVCCPRCETLYVNPRPTPEQREDFYAHSLTYEFWYEHVFPASNEARKQRIVRLRAQKVADLCAKHGLDTGTLLEVGCAFGSFCDEIAAFETIEHLFSPRQFMQACHALLAPGGLFVATCPNGRGFDIVTLGSISDNIDYGHLNYFNVMSRSRLLEQCGFRMIEANTPGRLDAELVRKKVLAGEFSLADQPFLRQLLVDEWERLGDPFQAFLRDNLLSSHLFVAAVRA